MSFNKNSLSEKVGLYAMTGILSGSYSMFANGLGSLYQHHHPDSSAKTAMALSAGFFALQCMSLLPLIRCCLQYELIEIQNKFLFIQGFLFTSVVSLISLDNLLAWMIMQDKPPLGELLAEGVVGGSLLTLVFALCQSLEHCAQAQVEAESLSHIQIHQPPREGYVELLESPLIGATP